MSEPSDPNKIVLKNHIYQNGLTSKDIYDYYIKEKENIIKSADNNPVLLFMNIDQTSPQIVKRKHLGKDIILTDENYETFINGHVISISYEPNHYKLSKIILDLDSKSKSITDRELILCIHDLINSLPFKTPEIYASSSGFHLIHDIKDYKSDINSLRRFLEAELEKRFKYKYYINDKIGTKSNPKVKINIDLSSMTKRGSITVPNSLTREGTIYMKIDNIKTFNRKETVIK